DVSEPKSTFFDGRTSQGHCRQTARSSQSGSGTSALSCLFGRSHQYIRFLSNMRGSLNYPSKALSAQLTSHEPGSCIQSLVSSLCCNLERGPFRFGFADRIHDDIHGAFMTLPAHTSNRVDDEQPVSQKW